MLHLNRLVVKAASPVARALRTQLVVSRATFMRLPAWAPLRHLVDHLARAPSLCTFSTAAAPGALGGSSPSMSNEATSPAAFPPRLLVKVGSGEYSSLRVELAEHMDRMDLLKALAGDAGFAADLQGMALGRCKVFVLKLGSVAGDEPTPPEEALANLVELRAAKTLGELMGAVPAGSKLFIRVRLPVKDGSAAVPATGTLPHNPSLGVAPEHWAEMGPKAQLAAKQAGEYRQTVRAMPVLQKLDAVLSAADAKNIGVEVVREDAALNVALGMFEMPAIGTTIALPPKTFNFDTKQTFLVSTPRLQHCMEFVKAVINRQYGAGVLFSGPNGVGKSAIGMMTYLVCVARGLLVAYISQSQDWVTEAEKGKGDSFLLETFWRQNADLIAASDMLRPIFRAALQDAGDPFSEDAMEEFRKAVGAPTGPGAGIIMDEVQNITQAVLKGATPHPTWPRQLAGDYFAVRWHDWTNKNNVFARMSIASSHGIRELKLPAGEERRLRIIEPLIRADIAALQSHKRSPAYIEDAHARDLVAYIAGGILRNLVLGASLLPKGGAPTRADLQIVWHGMWAPMMADCKQWLADLTEMDRKTAAANVMSLVRGELTWDRAKGLYDEGLVARSAASTLVSPVSPVAAAVILQAVAAHVRDSRVSLGTIKEGAARGYELERQVRACLNPCDQRTIAAKLLDGTATAELQLRATYALPFDSLSEVTLRDDPVVFIPSNSNYACDAIVMPPADAVGGVISVIECSVTDPRSAGRINKVRKWFAPNGIATTLRAAHPSCKIVCALLWDGVLDDHVLSANGLNLTNGVPPSPLPAPSAARGAGTADGGACATVPAVPVSSPAPASLTAASSAAVAGASVNVGGMAPVTSARGSRKRSSACTSAQTAAATSVSSSRVTAFDGALPAGGPVGTAVIVVDRDGLVRLGVLL